MAFPWISFLIVVACIFGLYFGADWLVAAAVRIARKLGVSPLFIGLTIVAIGTSAPEFAVSISSAARDEISISVGNIIGSNIFNLGFILGGLAFFMIIPTTRKLVVRDGGMLIATTALLVLFFMDGVMYWWEGVTFLTILVIYIGWLIYQQEGNDEELDAAEFKWTDVLLLLVGIGTVIVSSQYFVTSASTIAHFFGISEYVIGVTIVAFGTSAPEIATSVVALIRGDTDISAGNLIGSNLFNQLGVLGMASIITPGRSMVIDPNAQESAWILLTLMIVVVWFMRTEWKITRREGAFLFLIASVSWAFNFFDATVTSMISGYFQ
ncbi:MAG: cation:H+ antiporter [Cellvibrionaceae bacterium]|jgi:cation:H+ antiporter